MADYTKQIRVIDECIRENRLTEARARFLRLTARALPRRALLPAAVLARRLTLSSKAAQILNPVVRPPGATRPAGTAKERAEYALNLMRLGAREEAIDLLDTVDPNELPE